MNSIEAVKALEVELHQPEVRSDAERINTLLHESFVECGRSGQIFKRKDIVKMLSREGDGISIWSQDFSTEEISEGVILLTYLSAHVNSDDNLSHHTFRSSLWQKTSHGWQMRFHQGTTIDAFIQHTS